MTKKPVAAIVTEYRRHSHADILIGKIFEGFLHQGGPGPDLHLVSMYVDQFPKNDLSRSLARQYGFNICDTIEKALTLGGAKLAVDGVLIVAEHGKYPTNGYGQILYPRRRFFEEVTNTFVKIQKSVPIFNDKHLAATWADAKWMYNRARELFVPLMAGSTIPLTWRRPVLALPKESPLVEAVQIGYGPLEGYGFHALEGLQCMVERRRGGEVGVKSVQCLQGEAMWRAQDQGIWSRRLLEAGLSLMPTHFPGPYRPVTAKSDEAALFLIEYRDGFHAALAMMNGYAYEGDGGAFIFAGQLKGQAAPVATLFFIQQPDPFAHFGYLLRAIDFMVQTNHPAYPVERTLLVGGILDAGMVSKAENHRKVLTPHLDIRYQPNDWPFATDPVPKVIARP